MPHCILWSYRADGRSKKFKWILPENVNFAVAAPTIVKFLKANNINVPQGTNKIYKTKELAKIGEPATVQLLCLNTMEAYEKLLDEEDYSQVLLNLK